jgi:hypothetical protein
MRTRNGTRHGKRKRDDDVGEARRQRAKMLATRMLDERILKKELKIKYLEHKVGT